MAHKKIITPEVLKELLYKGSSSTGIYSTGRTLKVYLMNDSFVFNPATHKQWPNVSSYVLPSGNGYSPKSHYFNSRAHWANYSYNTAKLYYYPGDSWASWTASGGSIGPTNGAILWLDYSSHDYIWAYVDFGGSITIPDGESLVIKNIDAFYFNDLSTSCIYKDIVVSAQQNSLYMTDINGHNTRLYLMQSGFTWNPNVKKWDDISSQALASGNGYTAGTKLSYVSCGATTSGELYSYIKYGDLIFAANGGPIGPSPGAIIMAYKSVYVGSTTINNPILGYIDFGGDKTANDGDNFVINNIMFKLSSKDTI